jgi:predicted nucleic acid-binding protein
MTIQELEIGILRMERKDARQGRVLRDWFVEYVLEEFKDRTLPVTTEVARRSAALFAERDRSEVDMLIAATAYVHRFTLVSRNMKHLAGTGVRILNPWEHDSGEPSTETK